MVETHGFMGAVNNVLEWISRLALLNILWIFFTFLGLIVLGFYPATVAMFSVVRKWAMGDFEASVTKVFWNSYKKEFKKSNLLGGVISSVGLVVFIDFLFLRQASPEVQSFLFVPFLLILILFICTLFYVFPMYVHYEMSIRDVLKNSFVVMVMRPLSTLMILVCGIGFMILLSFAPPLLIICSGNVFALMMMKPAMNAFEHVNRKYEKAMAKELEKQNLLS
ncbi:YesL family protein [Bacillus sp. PS06]|uniref:YesL family protein n=1 Tax=Bacillus sp. PS06 TaxID=2764176 RepID=UPI001786935D|nr:YesL family protein [Bacillus sp. PS06]MBD8068689.1 YesL family protein [Bacillus sp. PS06]